MSEQPEAGEAVTVALAELVLNEDFQIRLGKPDPSTIKRYAQAYKAGTVLPPVKVCVLEGVKVLLDGWHRVAARKSLGLLDVDAVVVRATREEARWIAAEANLTHGRPLTAREVQEVFKAYVRAKKHRHRGGRLKSYREIGTELGRHNTTVRAWMQKHFPTIADHYAKDEGEGPKGGLWDQPGRTIGDDLRERLEASLALAQGEISRDTRRELLKTARALTRAIKEGPWPQVDLEDDL